MNATSLYVSTSKLALQLNADNPGCLTDLCRLMPYLRHSLACTVCGNLLIEPYTPTGANCQHHVCNTCRGGKKKLKPTCSLCKNYANYGENLQLRSLLQCYKRLCAYLMNSPLYRLMSSSTEAGNITDLIEEGVGFKDDFICNAGLSKSEYRMLPSIYTHTSTHTRIPNQSMGERFGGQDSSMGKQNGSSLYSVMYAESGNKMVIKRNVEENASSGLGVMQSSAFKKPVQRRSSKPRPSRAGKDDEKKGGRGGEKKPKLGCRCGNAAVAPSNLTCCGQRCPCYVESKACLECKCRGCRNPHTKEGQKVIREVFDLKTETVDDDLDSDILHMELDDLSQLDHVLELRSDSSQHDLDLL